MAEYIDKKYLDRKFQIDMMALRGGTIFDTKEIIDSLPTADVIERAKIDKAIKEIKEVSFKHNFEQGEYIGEITEQWKVVKLDHVIEIIKRNIGE